MGNVTGDFNQSEFKIYQVLSNVSVGTVSIKNMQWM